MLSDTLNTNEVKDAAGVECEFTRQLINTRETVFQRVAESWALPHRFSIRHLETGAGLKRRRRSAIRFDKTIVSTVDNVTPVTASGVTYLDLPVGALLANSEGANVLANLLSILATTGAGTTVLFNCTGTAAVPLLEGSL